MDWLRTGLGNGLLYHTVIAAVIVAAFYILSLAAMVLLGFMGRKIFARTATVLDDRILEVLRAHVKPLMVIVGLQVAVREIRKGALPSELTVHQILDYGVEILYVVLILLIVKILFGIFREVLNWYLDKVSSDGASTLKNTLGPLTNKLVSLLILLVAVIIVLDHFGVSIGSLLVSLGVGSLAVALAAQDTLANMIAGFVILVDSPFRVGDRIELATGQVGDVKEIGLRSTRVLNFDNNLIILPNAELIKSRLVNYSYPHLQTRLVLRFEVGYGTDPAKVRQVLHELADKQPGLLKNPAPRVDVTGMTDSSIQLTFSARCAEFSQQFEIEASLREQAYLAFLKDGIEMPIRHTVVHTKADA
jgi:MscS family membrane protein